jgi:multiple sugar transport system substrate-binding protein
MELTRRRLLGSIGGLTAAAALPGLTAAAADRSIRHFWWGNPERDKRTFGVIDVFQKNHPDIKVLGETIGWGDYWTKLATQTAGGNMADVVQMDYGYLFEYVRRGALKPLEEFVGGPLNLDNFDKAALAGGMVDGKLYGLSIGSNSQVAIYNTAIFNAVGVEIDPTGWTYDDLFEACKRITAATPEGMFGSDDLTGWSVFWEDWTQQAGHPFYNADGTIGSKPEILADFWNYWAEMRKAGVVPDAETSIGRLSTGLKDSGLVTGKSAIGYQWSNQIVGMQSLVKDPVAAAMMPKIPNAAAPGQFIKPAMFLSMTRDAKDTDAVALYMSDWINDPEETRILGLERGVPNNAQVRAALKPDLDPAARVSLDYLDAIQGKVGDLPPPAPKGAGEGAKAFDRWATDVLLDKAKPLDAANGYFEEVEAILARAQ